MTKRYSTKQLQEAVSYWRGVLRGGSKAWAKSGRTRLQITEAVEKWEGELNERKLSDKEVGLLASYIEKNKVDVAGMLKLEKVDGATAKKDEKVKAAYDELKKAAGELKFSNKSIPAFHRALKAIFKGKEVEAKDPKKVAETIKAEPEKVKKALEPVKAEDRDAKGGGDAAGKAAVDPKTEKAVEKKLEDATPEDIGAEDSEEAAEEEATSKPIGEMNLMDRLRRLHNATKKNVEARLAKMLPFKAAGKVIVENSCVAEGSGNFEIPDDGNMFITVKVRVDDSNRKGFKKFIGGMFGKAMNETDEEILEGVIGNFFGGLWKGSKEAAQKFAAGAKEGAEKAAQAYKDNLSKVNDEMKKRIGVAAIQEYVMRFCGKALAKKVNYQVIQVAIENEGTEDATYVFTGCIKVTK